MMDGKPDLLPCPFCGSDAELKTYRDNLRGDAFAVMCKKTDCPGRTYRKRATIKEAAAAWNRRAEPENRVLTLEEVKTHCEGGVEAAPLWVEFDEGLSRWVLIAPHEPGCELEYVSVFVSIMWPQYGKGWRCWLRKPTEEETAGTPWNEKGGTEK